MEILCSVKALGNFRVPPQLDVPNWNFKKDQTERLPSGFESNAAGFGRGRLHELADGFEEGSDVAVMRFNLPLKFGELCCQLLVCRHDVP